MDECSDQTRTICQVKLNLLRVHKAKEHQAEETRQRVEQSYRRDNSKPCSVRIRECQLDAELALN